MLILLRTYADSLRVVDTTHGIELNMPKEDINVLYRYRSCIYRINHECELEPISIDNLYTYYNDMMFYSKDKRSAFITLYRLSPQYSQTTHACYDIFVYDKGSSPENKITIKNLMLGGARSTHFIDEMVSHADESGEVELTCYLRKHEHVGHKSYDEYNAKWYYKQGNWRKEDWVFKENRTGW